MSMAEFLSLSHVSFVQWAASELVDYALQPPSTTFPYFLVLKASGAVLVAVVIVLVIVIVIRRRRQKLKGKSCYC